MISIRPASSPPPRNVTFTVGEVISIILLVASAIGGLAVINALDREQNTRIDGLERVSQRRERVLDKLTQSLHTIDLRLTSIEGKLSEHSRQTLKPTPSPP